MELIIYIILGAIQGFSEPIPISSSGHLVIFKEIFSSIGISVGQLNDISFEIIVNTGSLIAIILYYHKKIWQLIINCLKYFDNNKRDNVSKTTFRYVILLIIATIPAAIAGVLLDDVIAELFSNYKLVGVTLLITGGLLYTSNYYSNRVLATKDNTELNIIDSIVMGCAQAIALIPGISRSGSVICAGLFRKIDIKSAMDTAFMMYIPVSLGALILKLKNILTLDSTMLLGYLLAFITSIITTYIAVIFFFKLIQKRKLNYFAYYCMIIGLITIFII